MKIAIVTGASSGMGKEFALQIEKSYDLDEIWLIARRKNLLDEVAGKLECALGIVLPMSLTSKEDMERLKRKITEERPDIKILVNNAGYGLIGPFIESSLDVIMDMIDLNVKALVELTHVCIPYMHSEASIIQIGSVSGFMPEPNGAVYAATKAFVLSFSNALYQEVRNQGIHVVTVCPGPVETMFLKVASSGRMETPKSAAKAENVVRLALKDAKKGKLNSTYGFIPRVSIQLPRILSRKLLLKMLK